MLLLLLFAALWGALLWTFAIYALPALVGIYSGQLAHAHGAGTLGAFVIGIFVAVLCLATMRVTFARCDGLLVRAGLTIIFVTPTLIIVYNMAMDATLLDETVSPLWRRTVSVLVSGLAGLISYNKLAKYADDVGAK